MNKRITVMGYMFRCPIAGVLYQYLHYITGFQRLGYEVSYLEDDPTAAVNLTEKLNFADSLAKQYSFSWGYRNSYGNTETYGCSEKDFSDGIKNADAVFDICGVQGPLQEFAEAQCPVYVESDPGPDQIKLAKGNQLALRHLKRYKFHFTFGEKVGTPEWEIPDNPEIRWQATRQPVVMDFWQNPSLPEKVDQLRFTTITSWKAQGKEIEWQDDMYYWSKEREFLKFSQVPQLVQGPVPIAWELASGLDPESKDLMQSQGWILQQPKPVSEDPTNYRHYIQQSDGEWTIAKDQYTRLNTGWFSDRTVCYLAAARPVITQETGFSDVIPQGEGLFSFRDIEDIQRAVDRILTNPRKHSDAAREIASEYFDAEKVCRKLIERIGI